MKIVQIFCDGACDPNPGPGGYGAIIRSNGIDKEIAGGAAHTTNNKMEMMAAIVSLESLKKPRRVIVTTDSQYLLKGMTEWVHGWKRNGWVTSASGPVKNRKLWERLLEQSRRHDIKWVWVRGHAGHAENERCDALARAAVNSFKFR